MWLNLVELRRTLIMGRERVVVRRLGLIVCREESSKRLQISLLQKMIRGLAFVGRGKKYHAPYLFDKMSAKWVR